MTGKTRFGSSLWLLAVAGLFLSGLVALSRAVQAQGALLLASVHRPASVGASAAAGELALSVLARDPQVFGVQPLSTTVEPGADAVYTVYVTNTSPAPLAVALTMTHSNYAHFSALLSSTTYGGVLPDARVSSTLKITPTLSAPAGVSDTATITAAFDYTTTLYTDTVTIWVRPVYRVALSMRPASAAIFPETIAYYTVTVTNTGNASDAFQIRAQNSRADFAYTLSTTVTDPLPPWGSQSLALSVMPTVTVPDIQNVTLVTAPSSHAPSVEDSVAVTTSLLPFPKVVLPLVQRNYCNPWPVWQRGTGLPDNITVYTLALAPDDSAILYAGTDGQGVYKSTDRGQSWQPLGLSDSLVFSLAVDPSQPQVLYAATWGNGVQKTIDGGSSWQAMNEGLDGNLWLYALVIDRSMEGTLYAGTYNAGVYKTTDGGSNWEPVVSGLGSLNIRSLAIDPQDSQIVYAGTADNGIYKTVHGGDGWQPANDGLEGRQVWVIAVDPGDSDTLFAGTQDNGIFRSEDGGTNWIPVFESGSVYGLAIDPRNSQVVYAGTDGSGVYRTTNGGLSWQPLNEQPENLIVVWMTMDPRGCPVLYAATKDGVWWQRHASTAAEGLLNGH